MENRDVSVDVKMDEKIFRQFAVFDNLLRRRQWITLAAFTSIMMICACVCFAMRNSAAHAVMLGGVLAAVGLLIPAVYLWTFFKSIKAQIKAHKLDKPRLVYSLKLSEQPDGVRVSNPAGESAEYRWDAMYGVYRVTGCTYLYAAKNRAFILPDTQISEGPEVLWKLFTEMMPTKKLYGRLDQKR